MSFDSQFLSLLQRLTSARAQKYTTADEEAELRSYLERVPMPGEKLPPGVAKFDILATGMPASNNLTKDFRTLLKVGRMTYVHKMIDFDTLPDVFLTVLQTCAVADPNFFKVMGLSKAFAQEGYATYAYGKIVEGKANSELLRMILVCAQFQHDVVYHFVTKPVNGEPDTKQTRLHEAATRGNAALVEILLEPFQGQIGELLSLRNKNGETPVHCAIRVCATEVLDVMLVALRRDILNQQQDRQPQPEQSKPKLVAADQQDDAAGDNLDAKQPAQDNTVATPIIQCIDADDAELKLAKQQLAKIAKSLAHTMNSVQAVFMIRGKEAEKKKITSAKRIAMLVYLQDLFGQDYQAQALTSDKQGNTATNELFQLGDVELARQFMQSLNPVNQQAALLRTNTYMTTPIANAAWEGHSAMVQYGLSLLADNAAVAAHQRSSSGDYLSITLLHLVTRYCDDATVAALFNIRGYDASRDMSVAMRSRYAFYRYAEYEGAHPLQFAVVYGGFSRVKLFVDQGLVSYDLLQKTSYYKMYRTDMPFMVFLVCQGDPASLDLLMTCVTPAQAYALLTCTYDNSSLGLYAHGNQRYKDEMLKKIVELKNKYEHAKDDKLTIKLAATPESKVVAKAEDEVVTKAEDELVSKRDASEHDKVKPIGWGARRKTVAVASAMDEAADTPLSQTWAATFSQLRQQAQAQREQGMDGNSLSSSSNSSASRIRSGGGASSANGGNQG